MILVRSQAPSVAFTAKTPRRKEKARGDPSARFRLLKNWACDYVLSHSHRCPVVLFSHLERLPLFLGAFPSPR